MIHCTESTVYSMRLAGIRTRQIAISMSFVTSTLLVSRLSNMFQAPLLGAMVDSSIIEGTPILSLETSFRVVIFAAFLGTLTGALFTSSSVRIYGTAITRFLKNGSLPKTFGSFFSISELKNWPHYIKLPSFSSLKNIVLSPIPKSFLIFNIIVTSVYTVGVLCSLLAGAIVPELRSTAIQLSGIVNGIATILLTIYVDPAGARITDQTFHHKRPENHVKSVVFFLLAGRLLGTLILSQILFKPFSIYIVEVTKFLSQYFVLG
ncbi:MAG: DUF2837 family protein [Candidatus Margulisbacteria bacterium]|nr:DUF2837 family protein [Candidatus Margulisiibacteriota bacterium]